MQITVVRLKKLNGDSNLKAFADVSFDGIIVSGCKVFDGAKGLFAALPSQKSPKDDQYYPIVRIKDETLRNAFNDAVLDAYNKGVAAPAGGVDDQEVPF